MVNARKYGMRRASATCIPPIAEGDSIRRSDPWHACQDDSRRSSNHPRNWRVSYFFDDAQSGTLCLTYFLQTLLEEGYCKHAIINAHLHQFGRIAANRGELDAVLDE